MIKHQSVSKESTTFYWPVGQSPSDAGQPDVFFGRFPKQYVSKSGRDTKEIQSTVLMFQTCKTLLVPKETIAKEHAAHWRSNSFGRHAPVCCLHDAMGRQGPATPRKALRTIPWCLGFFSFTSAYLAVFFSGGYPVDLGDSQSQFPFGYSKTVRFGRRRLLPLDAEDGSDWAPPCVGLGHRPWHVQGCFFGVAIPTVWELKVTASLLTPWEALQCSCWMCLGTCAC